MHFFQAGICVGDPTIESFNGQDVELWPRVVWRPKWAPTFSEVMRKVRGKCSISQKSTLVINGRDIYLEDLSLDGSLVVNAVDRAEVWKRSNLVNAELVIDKIVKRDSLKICRCD